VFTARILLLGSGELGKEFVISAKRCGCHVVACDSYANAPAMQVADEAEVFSMLDPDALRAAIERHKPDFIVPEIEAIRTEVLQELEDKGFTVVPSARVASLTMNRDRIRELAATELGLRTSKYRYAESLEEVRAGAGQRACPASSSRSCPLRARGRAPFARPASWSRPGTTRWRTCAATARR
jgi:phosphoribosylglycinamide formyltransferase 2